MRHRDIPFRGFQWVDFSSYDVICEKPDPLAKIGNQSSLFCWTKNVWPQPVSGDSAPGGWLACDDGAMEIADFIHLDDKSSPPTLTLIHVKAAASKSPTRQVSVARYEVVACQDVKNLRYLDRLHIEQGLANGLEHKIGSLVWHDRSANTRKQMLAALKVLGTNYRRRVVIVQPHVRETSWKAAQSNPAGSDAARLRQLDTLLLSAEASYHALGAELVVIGARTDGASVSYD